MTSRRVGGDDVEVARTSQRGVYTGAYMAYLGDRVPQVYANSLRVTEPSRFYVLGAECFAQIMNEWFPLPVHLLEGLFFGGKRTQDVVGQRERLLALGSLTAGLTHELNNPAAAAVRATASLRERVTAMRGKLKLLGGGQVPAGQLRDRSSSSSRARSSGWPRRRTSTRWRLRTPRTRSPTGWKTTAARTPGSWPPVFVQAGLDTEWLDQVLDTGRRGDARARAALAELHASRPSC